jgi:hypothetical protein
MAGYGFPNEDALLYGLRWAIFGLRQTSAYDKLYYSLPDQILSTAGDSGPDERPGPLTLQGKTTFWPLKNAS